MAIEEALPTGRSVSGIDAAFEYAGYGRPYLGERLSGDVALAVDLDDRLAIALIDVLGHGPDAGQGVSDVVGHGGGHLSDHGQPLFLH